MPGRLREVEIEVGETIRLVGPNGRSFKVRLKNEDHVRFVMEHGEAQLVEFYGRGKDSQAIAGFKLL